MSYQCQLQRHSRTLDTSSDDGNCLFRCISKEFFGTEKYHLRIRQLTVMFLQEAAGYFSRICVSDHGEEQLEKRCTRMRNSCEWGSTINIMAVASVWSSHIPPHVPVHHVSSGSCGIFLTDLCIWSWRTIGKAMYQDEEQLWMGFNNRPYGSCICFEFPYTTPCSCPHQMGMVEVFSCTPLTLQPVIWRPFTLDNKALPIQSNTVLNYASKTGVTLTVSSMLNWTSSATTPTFRSDRFW